jgi:hypothetical protein
MEWLVRFLRHHWYDMGLVLAVPSAMYVAIARPPLVSQLFWLNFIFLLFHQVEEYRWPGTFPGMMNSVMFSSSQPDRYPLNSQSAFVINVGVGWGVYLAAALFGEWYIWIGIAAVLVSVGNVIAHALIFNYRGSTLYNPGMATAVLLFLPISVVFLLVVISGGLASPLEWVLGVGLGIALNFVGILKAIDWMKDPTTSYVFPQRNLPPRLRGHRPLL